MTRPRFTYFRASFSSHLPPFAFSLLRLASSKIIQGIRAKLRESIWSIIECVPSAPEAEDRADWPIVAGRLTRAAFGSPRSTRLARAQSYSNRAPARIVRRPLSPSRVRRARRSVRESAHTPSCHARTCTPRCRRVVRPFALVPLPRFISDKQHGTSYVTARERELGGQVRYFIGKSLRCDRLPFALVASRDLRRLS